MEDNLTGEALREKLKTEKMGASWNALEDHHKRKAVFIVDETLDLIEVSAAIAEDNFGYIKSLMESNQLINSNDMDHEELKELKELSLSFIIVSPYVLVQKNNS